MRIVKSVAAMRRLRMLWWRQGVQVGFVPTMGYLHAGHASLLHRARKLVGKRGKVVLSIYVNPTQFGPGEDFSRYPRDLARDSRLARRAGVDVIFGPGNKQMYPSTEQGRFSTFVLEEKLSQGMEGKSRPGHFRGVTTIVAKLFNVIQPDFAVFGAKDWQQAAVIKRMVRDLNFPLKLIIAPTFRESDGLALSSRNKYLEGALRTQARVLHRAILRAQAAVRAGPAQISAARLKKGIKRFIEQEPSVRLDYVEFFEPSTLRPLKQVTRGSQVALAAFVGKTRLIDNSKI
jgi:pantoate--beta-alanine ligase